MADRTSSSLYGRPAITRPSSKKGSTVSFRLDDDEAEHLLSDEGEDYPEEYRDEPEVPPALKKVSKEDIVESCEVFREIIKESGAILKDIEEGHNAVVSTLHEHDIFDGPTLIARADNIRRELSTSPDNLLTINGMIGYLEAIRKEFVKEKAKWSYHGKRASQKAGEHTHITGEQEEEDRTKGRKRGIADHKQKKINKRVKRLSKNSKDDDDEESSLSSSESKEKKPREEASRLSIILKSYGHNSEYINQKVIPEAKTIVELEKKTRHYHGARPQEEKTPYISSLALDDAKWIPAYLVQGLTKEKRKEKVKSYIEDQGTATLIQQVATFWTAHVVTKAVSPEAVISRILMTLKNVQQLGIAEARTYEKKLISHFNLLIQQGKPSSDLDKELSTQVDAVDKEVDRDTRSYQRQQNLKGKGKGLYYKGTINPYARTKADKAKGKGNYPKTQWEAWEDPPEYKNKDPNYPKGKGKTGKTKNNPENHICFHHDPRKNLECKKTGCKNQHLDTNIPSEAKRFDDAKSIADSNYQKKWGNV